MANHENDRLEIPEAVVDELRSAGYITSSTDVFADPRVFEAFDLPGQISSGEFRQAR